MDLSGLVLMSGQFQGLSGQRVAGGIVTGTTDVTLGHLDGHTVGLQNLKYLYRLSNNLGANAVTWQNCNFLCHNIHSKN